MLPGFGSDPVSEEPNSLEGGHVNDCDSVTFDASLNVGFVSGFSPLEAGS